MHRPTAGICPFLYKPFFNLKHNRLLARTQHYLFCIFMLSAVYLLKNMRSNDLFTVKESVAACLCSGVSWRLPCLSCR